jgi:chromosome segregation ATPase
MINKYLVHIIAALLALGVAAVLGYALADTLWQTKWAQAEKDAATAQLNAVNAAVDKYKLRVTELEGVNNEIKQQFAALEVSRARSDAASDGLQQSIADSVRRGSQCTNSAATTAERAAAATSITVLADVLRRADRRAGDLAEIADRSRIAGLGCQAAYAAIYKGS